MFNSTKPAVVYGESPVTRTAYTVVSLACISLLAGILGYRAKHMEWHTIRSLNFTRVLVLIQNFLALSFVTSAAIVESGMGLATQTICHSAVMICLGFYVGGKVTMYVFLVERAHAMRAPYMQRLHDWIWLLGMFTVGAGFGSIAIVGFLWPIAHMSSTGGRCRIGLPFKVTIPLLTFDGIINIALTGIFVYLLRPLLRFRGGTHNPSIPANKVSKSIRRVLEGKRSSNTDVYPVNQQFLKSIEALLWKSLIGSVLVMLPTIGNLASLCSLQGQEFGWLCLMICTFDSKSYFMPISTQRNTRSDVAIVTWAVGVIHWLTIGSTEVDERTLAMLVSPDTASNTSTAHTVTL
ncbi:hypothetical protein P154DRAFT_426697 [Amniculicola lignicola CBS 123094]|uniref:Uncharacterized protein n=1 Tax=Amniculicola lignicola CBS 123094 TaxID=1392246 RepID=A0A6A5WRE7_9PLEO|nr:hypothetical protein P154DRAFT_426697 [Amniculicola lignicola CBS 123094]